MNIVGVTQGSNLKVFLRLVELLRQRRDINKVAAFVADSMTFKSLQRVETTLQDGSIELLKEWEIVTEGRTRLPNWERLEQYERELGDPVLWNVLMADRRIYFGRRCKMRQDYRPRFTHREMGGIIQLALEQVEAFLERVDADLVIGFGTSTIGDYLFYRFAKGRNIPYLQLKSTKIWNRVALNDDAVKLSAHIAEAFHGRTDIPDGALEDAQRYLEDTRKKGVRYEGAIVRRRRFSAWNSLVATSRGIGTDIKRLFDAETRRDNHVESSFLTHFHERLRNPLKASFTEWRLGHRLSDLADLSSDRRFVFFPLHFEPEVSLQVFGRPYQNQIEIVRVLAASLPAGMDVLVKEHPRARGFRSWGYYRKLLEIPNVQLLDADVSTLEAVRRSELVAVISGSTGLEAAICGRPVITFGTPVYNVLHGNMIRHVTDLNRLAWEIRSLLEKYNYDEDVLRRYIASTITGSVAVDLYTTLLGKTGRMREGREDMGEDQRRQEDYKRLADYCNSRIDQVLDARGQSHVRRTEML